jgi:anthranilate phosphoribosyltransferase
VSNLLEGIARAGAAIDDGRAAAVLENLGRASNMAPEVAGA